jgi:LuxR family maltose regulon positive regulatory protein
MRGRPSATYVLPFIAVRLRKKLSKLYLALGDLAAARQLLREIDDILLRRPALGTLVGEVDDLRRLLASGPIAPTGPSPLTPAELRLLPYLQTHLTLRAIAERLFISRPTVNSEVASIYRKLGASSRRDAVERATAVGLLGG